MNKLVACALLGFGLTQVLVGCSDDDDAPPVGGSGSGTAGDGGSSTAGKSSGGSSSAGKGGSATAGSATAGSATGGNASAGSAGKGGSAAAGTSAGGEGGVPGGAGEAGMAGMAGETGDGGMAGAGGAPPVEPPEPATPLWLSDFCEAKSLEVLGCENSTEWYQCFSSLRPFMYSVAEGICPGEEDLETPVKTLALYDAMDALAAACPDPDVSQWECTFTGAPRAEDQACQDADDAVRVAFTNCNP